MNMKKKIVTGGIAVAMAATLIGGMSLAYFTDTKTATNTFTLGNVTIELTEPHWENEGASLSPSVSYAKDPTITNTGSEDCYVRVKVEYDQNVVELGELGAGWTLHTDGYYYYANVVEGGQEPDAATTPVFSNFKIKDNVDNSNAGAQEIKVTAYAVQAAGVSDTSVTGLASFFDKAFTPATEP